MLKGKAVGLLRVSLSADFLFIHMIRMLQKMKFSEKRKYSLRDDFANKEHCSWENWALEKAHLTFHWRNREHWIPTESPHTHLEFLAP